MTFTKTGRRVGHISTKRLAERFDKYETYHTETENCKALQDVIKTKCKHHCNTRPVKRRLGAVAPERYPATG